MCSDCVLHSVQHTQAHSWFTLYCISLACTILRYVIPYQTPYYTNIKGWTWIAQSVQQLVTGWTVRGSNPCGGENFRSRPNRPRRPLSLLYNAYRVSFPRIKWPEHGVNHPPPSNAEVNNSIPIPLLPLWAFMASSRLNFTLRTNLHSPGLRKVVQGWSCFNMTAARA